MNYLKRFVVLTVLYIIFSVGLMLVPPCYAEENEVDYKSIAYNFYRMDFVDASTGWICGKSGYMYATHDGGLKWKRLSTDTVNSLFGVHFFDPNNGVVVGQAGLIMSTDDAGLTWTRVKSPTEKSLLTMDFYDRQNGMAAGDWGRIIVTRDGGKTWQDISLEQDILLYYLKYIGPQEIWIAAEMGTMFHSTDGGGTWESMALADGTLFGFDMDAEGNGFAVGVGGTVISTQDGGKTWDRQEICKDSLYAVKIQGGTAIAIGDVGEIYTLNYRSDRTWRKIDVPNDLRANWLHSIENLDNDRFIVAGARGSISFIENGRLSRPES